MNPLPISFVIPNIVQFNIFYILFEDQYKDGLLNIGGNKDDTMTISVIKHTPTEEILLPLLTIKGVKLTPIVPELNRKGLNAMNFRTSVVFNDYEFHDIPMY